MIIPLSDVEALLLAEGHCSSSDEANGIAEIIVDDVATSSQQQHSTQASDDDRSYFPADEITQALQDCMDLSAPQCDRFISKLKATVGFVDDVDSNDDGTTVDSSSSSSNYVTNEESDDNDDSDGDDDGQVLEDGECELCERFILLTRHHLIPKETWARIVPKFMHAVVALEAYLQCEQASIKGKRLAKKKSGIATSTPTKQQQNDASDVQQPDEEQAKLLRRAETVLGDGLKHWIPILLDRMQAGVKSRTRTFTSITRSTMKLMLQHHTIDICRPCHSQIHRTHDNMTLALEYNTAESILNDDSIRKFCKWANKQKAGKYSVNR